MSDPQLIGPAKEEWEKLQAIVERDIENLMDDELERRAALNRARAQYGLSPISSKPI